MKIFVRWIVIALLSLTAACVWQPISYTEKASAPVDKALVALRAEDELQSYFDEAVAYAVFPTAVRGGTGFGGAYGSGWLFQGGEVQGKVMMLEVFAGADFGVQAYRSILFFRTDKSVERFKRGRFEFTGQANVAVIATGASVTPSFNSEVAMFTQVRGGLLLEASIGTQRYDYFPIVVGVEP